MDLTKKIDLYHGHQPIKESPALEEYRAQHGVKRLDKHFHGVYVQNDVPSAVHQESANQLLLKFAGRNGIDFIVGCANKETGLLELGGPTDHNRVAMVSFSPEIAQELVKEFQTQGYKIIKKYD